MMGTERHAIINHTHWHAIPMATDQSQSSYHAHLIRHTRSIQLVLSRACMREIRSAEAGKTCSPAAYSPPKPTPKEKETPESRWKKESKCSKRKEKGAKPTRNKQTQEHAPSPSNLHQPDSPTPTSPQGLPSHPHSTRLHQPLRR